MIKKIKKEYIFPIIIFAISVIFSILFPMYQIPDELKHIQLTYEELGQDYDVYDDYCKEFDVVRIANNPDEKVNYKAYFNFDIRATSKLKLAIPKITIVRHLPQSLSILVGHLFNLPIIIIILIGEVLAALTYAIACYITLKLMPFKKNIMKFIMLLPVLIQQSGSFSYDVVLVSACFILISYILHLKFSKDKIDLSALIKIVALLLIIFLVKIPYILLGLLVFILPIKKIDVNIFKLRINEEFINKYKKELIVLLTIIIIIGIFVMTKITVGKTLLAFFINPVGLFKVIYLTLKYHGTGLVYTVVGNLGWLDVKTSIIFCIFVFISGIIFSFFNYKKDKSLKQQFTKKEIIYLVLLFIFLCVITMLSLFEWSLTNVNNIDGYELWSIKEISNFIRNNDIQIYGLQGRYFVPLLPIICLPIFHKKTSDKLFKYHKIYEYIYFGILIIYLFLKILFRYWI